MEIWMHRLRSKPKDAGNTESGLIALYNLGIRRVETDVVSIADGTKIIYHPGTTKNDLTVMTWREIARAGLKIMTLNKYLHILKICKITSCLEFKQNSERLVEDVVAAVTAEKLQDYVLLTAFQTKIDKPFIRTESDGQLLLHARKLNPHIKTHLIAGQPWKLPELVRRYHPNMISFGWVQEPPIMKAITKPLFKLLTSTVDMQKKVQEAQSMKVQNTNVKVMAGIVNDTESMRYFAEMGVNGIMTDDAVLGMKFKKNLGAANG